MYFQMLLSDLFSLFGHFPNTWDDNHYHDDNDDIDDDDVEGRIHGGGVGDVDDDDDERYHGGGGGDVDDKEDERYHGGGDVGDHYHGGGPQRRAPPLSAAIQ